MRERNVRMRMRAKNVNKKKNDLSLHETYHRIAFECRSQSHRMAAIVRPTDPTKQHASWRTHLSWCS